MSQLTAYKSSPSLVFRNFVLILIVPVLLFAVLSTASDAQDAMAILFLIPILAAVLAAYFAFYRNNITIEITADSLKFSRHGITFLNFNRETHKFTSNIIVSNVGATRYLRVIPKDGGKYKDYECHNFDKKTFEEFITVASISPQEQQAKADYYNKETLTFTIDKNFMLKKYRTYKFISLGLVFAALLCLSAITLLPNDISQKAYFIITLSSIIIPIFSILKTVQVSKVKNQTPEKITISKDKLTVDKEDFYFSYLNQIKMTPPSYESEILTKEPWKVRFRKMTITERNIAREYILDFLPEKNGKPQSAFPEYSILFNELRELFINSENKFIVELE